MAMQSDIVSQHLPTNHVSRACGIPVAESWTQRDANEYNIGNPHNGHCLIFYHEVFELHHLEQRKQAEVDKELLENCFSSLGFKVRTFKDHKKSEITKIITEESERNHEGSGCFVCCISSHGSDGNLYAKDGKYPLRKIYEPFTADKCLSLAGKPKLFFIQACQGSKFDSGVVLQVCNDKVDFDMGFKVCTHADFLMVYSSAPGYVSFNRKNGSWLIKSIHDIFIEHHHDKDLLSMLTLVNRKVCIEYESNNPTKPEKHKKKQVPCIVSTLIRDLYFH